MAQNPWTIINDALSGRRRADPPARERPQPAPVRPNTRSYSEEEAQAALRARRMREMNAAIARTQAARPHRPLTEREIAQIRARYQ